MYPRIEVNHQNSRSKNPHHEIEQLLFRCLRLLDRISITPFHPWVSHIRDHILETPFQ